MSINNNQRTQADAIAKLEQANKGLLEMVKITMQQKNFHQAQEFSDAIAMNEAQIENYRNAGPNIRVIS